MKLILLKIDFLGSAELWEFVMKKKDILIISSFRKKSFRCKNKMLRKFSNTTLTDIILKKLKLMKNFDCYASVYDKEFKKMYKK